MANVDISQLANAIEKELEAYSKEVSEGVNESAKEVAKESVNTLKQTSPKRTGKYARGWRNTERKNVRGAETQVIHNKTNYQLVHLLERGHAKRGGGRVPGRPHVKPVEKQAIKEFENKVRKVARG